jgi:hypothetical protein
MSSLQDTNLYRALRQVIQEPPLLHGSVIAVHASDNQVTVQYPGGGTQRVRGSGVVSEEVWVKDGQVQGPAPTLVAMTIEV